MLLGSERAVAFIDNHDTQRNGRARLTYKDGARYALAEAFMLAWPYGNPSVMSSFGFTNPDAGPPAASDGTTSAVTCGGGQIAFGRGEAGFAAFNTEGGTLERTFQTGLPAGTYCDVAAGDFAGGTCTGRTFTVNDARQVTLTVPANAMVALHAGARVS